MGEGKVRKEEIRKEREKGWADIAPNCKSKHTLINRVVTETFHNPTLRVTYMEMSRFRSKKIFV